MFKHLRKYNRSVVVTWLLSYVSVLLVPILISFVLYSVTFEQVKAESNRANALLLQQMEMTIDNRFKGLKRLSLEIALNKNISRFSSVELPLQNEHYYDLFQISESLRTYKNASDYIEDIYVMYSNSDTVISTYDHTSREGLFQKLRQKDTASFKEWSEPFEQKYINSYTPMQFKDGTRSVPVVVFAHSLVFNTPGQPPATVLFMMKGSKLMESVPQQKKEGSLFILDDRNRFIAASPNAGSLPANLTYDQLQGEQGVIYKSSDKGEAAVSFITSPITGWKYISVLPAAVFNEKMENMRRLTWISISVCFVLGGLIAFLFLRKNYTPVRSMLQSLSQHSGTRYDGGGNEYSFMQHAIRHFFAEKEDMVAAFHKHRSTIRTHFIRRLLKGYSEKNAPIQESLSAHDMYFPSDSFAVMLISVDHYGKFKPTGGTGGDWEHKQQMIHFILTNVMQDAASDMAVVYTAEANDVLACIVNFKIGPEGEQKNRFLAEMSHQVIGFMREHIQSEVTIGGGSVHHGIEGIARSYAEALDALEYKVVLGGGQYIAYGDTLASRSLSHRYYYPLAVEQQLIYAVKSGNYHKAESLLEDIFEQNFSVHPVSVPIAKCLIYNLGSTLLNTLEEVSTGSKPLWEDHFAEVEQMMDCEHVFRMKDLMKRKLREVCEWIQSEKRSHHRYLVEDIKRYLEQHLYDSNLNISMIGEAFRMTPSYLSRLYKEHAGETLLDTINRSRLSEAKRLLVQQSLTVSEIAGRVGYADVSTFMRIFKKFEGMTPGMYTKSLALREIGRQKATI